MKIIFKDEDLIIYVYKTNLLEKDEIEDYIKDLIYKLRKSYHKNISGFYDVDIFINERYGFIIEMKKNDDLDFFPDMIDLKMNFHFNSDIFLKFEDYFLINKKNKIYFYLNNYYVNINEFTNEELITLSEFFKITYGNELTLSKRKFTTVK